MPTTDNLQRLSVLYGISLDDLLDDGWELGRREAEQPEAEQPEAIQPEAEQPEAVQPEAEQPEAVQPEAVQPEAEQPEAPGPEEQARRKKRRRLWIASLFLALALGIAVGILAVHVKDNWGVTDIRDIHGETVTLNPDNVFSFDR